MKSPFSFFAFLILFIFFNSSCYTSSDSIQYTASQPTKQLPRDPAPGKCYIRCVTPEIVQARTESFPVYTGGEIDPNELENLKIILKPKMTRWEYRQSLENCQSSDPNDCLVLCYVEHPEESVDIVVVKDTSKTAFFEYQSFTFEDTSDPGGVAVWEEIDCKLTEHNDLPIHFEPNSSSLNDEAKETIDKYLLNLMKRKPNIRLEVSSHTDSRGGTEDNNILSKKQADAVVEYLQAKGIQKTRLVAKGYGESRPKNGCTNGVNCSEVKHAENVRTEFRVLSN